MGPTWGQPTASEEKLRQAQQALEEQRVDDAAKLFEKILSEDPNNRVALFQLGWIYNERQEFEKALGYFTKIEIEKNQGHKVLCEMGYSQKRLTKFDAALASYRKASELRSDYLPALQGQGEILFACLKNYEQAKPVYEKLLQLQPNNPLANYRYGWCMNDSGHPDKAVQNLQQATKLEPRYKAAWIELSYCLLKLERPKDAYAAAHKALELDSKSVLAHDYAGRAAHWLKKSAEAQEHLKVLKDISPSRAALLEKYMSKP